MVGQAFQMIDGCQRGKFRHSGDNGVIDFVLPQARAGGEEGGSMCCSLALFHSAVLVPSGTKAPTVGDSFR